MARKRVYVLPNMFTTANLFLGMLAIIEISHYIDDTASQPRLYLHRACWYIIAAAIMDVLDGKVARVMRAESEFGVQYDSLADLVSFGAAPAFLIYIRFLRDIANQRLAALATVMFVICGALRLARFNVQRSHEEKKHFTGLPIPAAACSVISAFLLLSVYEINWLIRGLPLLMVVLSLLMVSQIPYPSIKSLPLEKARSFGFFFTFVLITILIYGLKDFKEALVFGAFSAYLAYGIGMELYKRITGRKHILARMLENPSLLNSDDDEDEENNGNGLDVSDDENGGDNTHFSHEPR
ncbi:CDP-diacylglycerol--serine O-phosphatidyltransferase [Candidatus Sumerlaeota bacterium]|nr:CDP-diacylglycerol--serine O-phosphatidyltransferase [Candidatus Sumerlaeota bacterium]